MSPWYAATDGRPLGKVWRAEGICHLSDCIAPWLGVGPFAALCGEHALVAAGVPHDRSGWPQAPGGHEGVRQAFRETLRMAPAERALLLESLRSPAPTRPPASYAPGAPDEALLAAAVLTMQALGAEPLRTERTFGVPCGWGCAWRPPGKTPREYDKGRAVAWDDEVITGLPGLEVDADDEAVPSGARTFARAALKAGWAVRIMAGPETVIFAAERRPVLLLARYERGRYVAGWLRGRGGVAPCTAKQLGELIKGGAA